MKYIIASHGEYAKGLQSAIKKVAGNNKEIYIINAYTDDESLEAKTQKIISAHEKQSWIIFTDLLGGSVNQYMMKNWMNDQIRVIAGINLYSLLLILQLEENSELDHNICESLIEARSQMCYMNSLLEE